MDDRYVNLLVDEILNDWTWVTVDYWLAIIISSSLTSDNNCLSSIDLWSIFVHV